MPCNFSANTVLLVQALSHSLAVVFSLFISVPMSIHQEHFKGHCILFSTGRFQERDGQFLVDWASQAYCNFTIFVSVVVFLVTLGLGARSFDYLRRGTDASFFAAFCEVLADGCLSIMTLLAALFVTLGFRVWCGEMTRRFAECSEAAGNKIDPEDGIDSGQFYFHLSMCQFGVWLCFICCFTAFVFAVVKLCRYHHLENLRVSMAKERKRLINEDLGSEAPVPGSHAGGCSGAVASASSSDPSAPPGGSSRRRGRTGRTNRAEEKSEDVREKGGGIEVKDNEEDDEGQDEEPQRMSRPRRLY